MIQSLRTANRRVFAALAFVLPAVIVVGLVARRPPLLPSSKKYDREARQPTQRVDQTWLQHKIHSVRLRNANDPATVQIVLEPLDDISAPDLLVYWSPELSGSDSLPTGAVLLGAFESSKPLQLRDNHARGFLVLYSLAHRRIIDAAPLESLL